MQTHIREYYKSVCEAYRLGNIESSYNTPIITLFTAFGCIARDLSGARGGDAGENIDIKLWHALAEETEPFAGIEVKKIGGIDARAKAQIKKEAARFGGAILTDNLVWQFWRAGADKMTAGVQLMELKDGRITLREDNIELFTSLVNDFLLQDPAQIRSSDKLAQYMAMHARTIKACITGILKDDGTGCPLNNDRQRGLPMFPELYGLYNKLKQDLTPSMTTYDFADMYAQTVVYGLFIARYNDTRPETFNRYEAIGYLQAESALLNRFFTHIAGGGQKHPTLDAVIDKLCALYGACDISALLSDGGERDTIIHFYETFLTYYDPALRKALGVFYTPAPAARYLAARVDEILKADFGIEGGLSNNETISVTVPAAGTAFKCGLIAAETRYDARVPGSTRAPGDDRVSITTPRVAILDPAAGTGSFLAEIIKYIKETYFSGFRAAFYRDYIEDENGLISRLIGFEIMMTSYVVAHLKIRRTIDETLGIMQGTRSAESRPYDNQGAGAHVMRPQTGDPPAQNPVGARFIAPAPRRPARIYLTNTLSKPISELEITGQISLFDFSAAISDEAYQADAWKTRRPIKVIIGNPPYLAASTNPYDISAYKTETDGVTKIKAKNLMNLGDDYVKFFCFAEQIINKNNEGVLAYVSNNGYLDNPTYRGMRASLLRTFDKIYIVNLHGSVRRQEKAPDGGKDENIFDIMQGVSLFLGVKTTAGAEWGKVYYADLWGTREQKFEDLDNNKIKFKELTPDEKMAYFVPFGGDEQTEYERGISVTELFPQRAVGIETGRDGACVQDSRGNIEKVLDDFRQFDAEQLREKYSLGKDTPEWTAAGAKKDVEAGDGKVIPVAYRPFDKRWTYYTGRSKGFHRRPRGGVMEQMLYDPLRPLEINTGLVFTKGDTTPNEYSMVFVSDTIIDNRITAAQTAGFAYIAPLYLKSEPETEQRAADSRPYGEPDDNSLPESNTRAATNRPCAAYDIHAGANCVRPPLPPSAPDWSPNLSTGCAGVPPASSVWLPNLDPAAASRLTEHLPHTPTPLEIFDYVYGILHDPVYRRRFNEFLKRGFPRVPVINNKKDESSASAFFVSLDMYKTYVSAGARLRNLHLMREKAPAELEILPNDPYNLQIEQIKYANETLSINKHKRITGIRADVWQYRIGGYQVLDKWLKSRKGETLTIEHFSHIANVAGLIAETIKIQNELTRLHK